MTHLDLRVVYRECPEISGVAGEKCAAATVNCYRYDQRIDRRRGVRRAIGAELSQELPRKTGDCIGNRGNFTHELECTVDWGVG